MQTVSIDKVKIKDGLPTINYTAVDAKGKKCMVPGAEYTDPVHVDFQKRLDALNVHLALSTSMLPIPSDLGDINEELLSYYHMHGVSIKDDGVTLSGHKILPNKKAFNFNSPFIRFSESEETQYTFVEELIEALEDLKKETNAYIDGSKRADDAQLSLNFDAPAETVTNAQILPPAPPVGTFRVESSQGIVDLPILPENGTVADVDTKPAKKKKADAAVEPFERPMMDPFPEDVAIQSTSEIDKKDLKTKNPGTTTKSRKRVPQSAETPSGILEEQ